MARRSDPTERLKDALIARLLALPDLELRPSRFGGAEALWLGRREVAHFHGEAELDVRLTRAAIRARRAELAADPRVTTRGSSDWLAFRFAAPDDLERALELVRLACQAAR